MEKIADSHKKHLDKIKKNVESCQIQDRDNNERYNRYRTFVLKTTINENDKSALDSNNQPVVEVNIIESIMSRLWAEFSKQTPNIMIRGNSDKTNPLQVDTVEAILRSIFNGSVYENLANEIFQEITSGGKSVARVLTDYENENSMHQVIKISKVSDPTYTGFDPLAIEYSKSDGQYCFELFPKYKEDLEEEFPDIDFTKIKRNVGTTDFKWMYYENDREIFYVSDYYEKKYKYVTMYEINDPRHPDQTHSITKEKYEKLLEEWDDPVVPPPEILEQARRKRTTIWRYKFINTTLLERPEETDFTFLPLIFFDGNSVTIKRQQTIRPMTYNVVDAQRGKNFAYSNILNDMQNARETDVLIAKSSWPQEPEYADGWKNTKKAKAALVWEDRGPDGQENPKPEIFPRGSINGAYIEVFDKLDTTIQMILGSYDAQLGIQKSQISGQAIRDGAAQSNNASAPFVVKYIASLNQMAKVAMSLLPKYYKTMRTVPITLPNGKHSYKVINDSQDKENGAMMDFDHNDLEVVVTAGANFDVQRQQSMETMIELMKVMPSINALMNEKGLPWMLDNIELRGKEHIKQMAEEFIKEQQQKSANQKNPEEEMMRAQLQIEQQKLQLMAQKQQGDMAIAAEKLKQSEDEMTQKQRLDLMTLLSESEVDMAKIENDKMLTMVRITESQNEAERTEAEFQMKKLDSEHEKVKGMIEGAMKMKEMHESREDRRREHDALMNMHERKIESSKKESSKKESSKKKEVTI